LSSSWWNHEDPASNDNGDSEKEIQLQFGIFQPTYDTTHYYCNSTSLLNLAHSMA
jgi:hypothetical protein